MPVAKASSPAASGAETCQKAYEANEPAPIAPVTASHTERRSASQRSLAAPSASRDTAPPACEQATRSPGPRAPPRRRSVPRASSAARPDGRRAVRPAARRGGRRDRSERDLKACQTKARDEARREGRDPQHPEGARAVGPGENRQEKPPRGHERTILEGGPAAPSRRPDPQRGRPTTIRASARTSGTCGSSRARSRGFRRTST